MKLKILLQGFGLSILVLLLRVWPFVSPRHSVVYHNLLPIDSLVWGVLIQLVVLALLTSLLFTFLDKRETGWRSYLWAFLLASLVPFAADDLAALWQTSPPPHPLRYGLYASLLFLILVRVIQASAFRTIVHGARALLLLAGLALLWMPCELLYMGLRSQPPDRAVPYRRAGLPSTTVYTGGKRIVWILFDELSYRQVFEHRYPGLLLPNFDQLKRQSTSFSNVSPAGYNTQEVVPSLFFGRMVRQLRSDLAGKPSIQFAGSKDWRPFDAQQTIFADAQKNGWSTGVVGWYHPYCRVLQGTLDSCFWQAGDGLWNGTTPRNSAVENAWAPLRDWLGQWMGKSAYSGGDKHAADLAALTPEAESLIRDESIRFAFIHLSVPHPPGIFDRKSGRVRPFGTYLDNLALADRTLGDLMNTVNATPSAANTTVIVCSDHSWRLPLWRPTPQWSHEETIASEGHFDNRPVLLIHSPGQQQEQDVATPFAGVRIHEILEEMLREQEPVHN